MDDISKGNIYIGNELFYPGYTFEQFKKSCFYTNQDGVREIKLSNIQKIWNHYFIVNFIFIKGKLYSISLYCVDKDSFTDEHIKKNIHDGILKELGLHEYTEFTWGHIESFFEARSGSSIIGVYYS